MFADTKKMFYWSSGKTIFSYRKNILSWLKIFFSEKKILIRKTNSCSKEQKYFVSSLYQEKISLQKSFLWERVIRWNRIED